MATARLFVRWLVLVLVLALAPAGARAEESGGRSLDVTAATLAPQIAGEAAPLGFHFLRVEFRFANTGTAPIADVALGRQSWVLEDGLFPYYAEERVGPVSQASLFQPETLAPQQGMTGEIVVLVPAAPGALALVYEADGVRLEVPLAVAVPEDADAPVAAEPAPEVPTADADEATPAPAEAETAEASGAEEELSAEEQPAAAPTVATDRATYAPGDTIVVRVGGLPGNAQDWVALVPEGAPEDSLGQWTYTDGVTEGEFRFRAPPALGRYEVRVYFDFPDGGYTVHARAGLEVAAGAVSEPEPAPEPVAEEPEAEPEPEPLAEAAEPAPVELATDREVYQPGETIAVTAANLPGHAEDLLTLVGAGEPDDAYGDWAYTDGVVEGSFVFTAPEPGDYELRLLPGGSIGVVAARVPVRVEAAPGQPEIAGADEPAPPEAPDEPEQPVLAEEPDVPAMPEVELVLDRELFEPGQMIEAWVTGLPGAAGDGLALVAAGAPDDARGLWVDAGSAADGRFAFTAPDPGAYELRAIAGGSVVARQPLTVEGPLQPPAPATVPGLSLAQAVFEPGAEMLVAYAVPEPLASGSWIGIVPADVPHGSSQLNDMADVAWSYLDAQTSGVVRLTAPREPGRYDVRLNGDAVSAQLETVSIGFVVSVDGTPPPEEPARAVELVVPETPINVAAAPFGARVYSTGGEEQINDGNASVYDRYSGYGYAGLGMPIVVDLGRPYALERVRMLLWDGDDRTYGYRIDGTVDGSRWQLLADHSAGGARGWQEIAFAPTTLRYLRVVGTTNTAGHNLDVVELEAYSRDGVPFLTTAETVADDAVPISGSLAFDLLGGTVANAGDAALIDGDLGTAAWTAAALPRAVEIRFNGGREGLVEAVALRSPAREDATRPRVVELAAATGNPADPWQSLGRFGLFDEEGWQRIALDPFQTAAIRVTVTEGYDPALPVAVAEVAVLEGAAPGYPSILPGRHPGFAGGPNIAAAALGGRIERATAPMEEGRAAELLIDGLLSVHGSPGWATAGATMPQEVVVSFRDGQAARIAAVALNAETNFSGFENAVRTFEVWVSQAAPDSGFTRVGGFYMEPRPGWQVFAFEPVTARYVQLRILSNHGGSYTALGEFEVLEAVSPDYQSILAGDPPNLAAAALGGHYAVPHGSDRMALIDGLADGPVWYQEGWASPPIDVVLAFREQRTATIDAITITPPASVDPEDWAREIKVSVSTTSPIGGFATVGTFTLAPEVRPQRFAFPPVEARYVQLRILGNGGGGSYALAEVAVHEHLEPGVASALSRLPVDATGLPPLPPAPSLPGEPEPNDVLAAATPIRPGQTLTGLIDPPDDIDLYRLDTTGERHPGITVSVAEDPALRVGIDLLDETGQPIDQQPLYERTGSEATLTWAVPQGVYYLRVHRPPTSIVVQSDLSPSTDNVRDSITAALRAFVGQVTEFEQVSIAGFCGEIDRASDFTGDRAVLAAAVDAINYGCGGTALYRAIGESLVWLDEREGGRAVLVITDAEDSGYHDDALHALWTQIGETSARIYGIGYGDAIRYQISGGDLGSTGGDLLRSLAAATGGAYFEAPTGDAIHAVTARISEELRRPSLYRLTVTTPQGEGALSVVEVGESIAGVAAPSRIALIFDASGSMWARDGGSRPRIEIAREVMRSVVTGLPDQVQVGLRVYGHNYPRDPKARSCTDSELVIPFGPLDRAALISAIDGLNPQGQTPIGLSLASLREDFAGVEGPKVVILVTDGIETCDPEPGDPNYPPAVVQALLAEGLDIRVNVVGFAIDESDTRDFLRQIADLSGGQYFEAASAGELQAALEEAMRAPFAVVDARGERVAEGKVNEPPLLLAEGAYRVEVEADPPIVVEVAVAVDQETRVLLDREGSAIGIELESRPYDPAAMIQPPVLELPQPARPLGVDEIAELQRLLAARGYDPGPADGRAGPATTAAIRAYQRAEGLPETGVADSALLDRLRAPVAAAEEGGAPEGPVEPDPASGTLPPVGGGAGTISSTPSVDEPVAGVRYLATPVTMYASGSSRVRSGPGTGYPQLGSIPAGGAVTVLGEMEGWYYLETADGIRGFTAANLVSPTRPVPPSPSRPTGPTGPTMPTCRPGETVIQVGPGAYICAVLQ